MISFRKLTLLSLSVAACVVVSGCSTVSRLNPFNRDDDDEKAIASQGERIPVIALDQSLQPADALKGVDYYLPPPVVMESWPLPGGNLEQAVGHVEAAPNLQVAWRKSFGEGSKRGYQVTAPPVAAEGRVYVMDGAARVSAFDARSGHEIWSARTRPDVKRDKEAYGGGLAFAGGKLYVSSGYRFVAQLDAATGALDWRTTTEQPLRGAPTVANGRVFAITNDNVLLTFDTATGAAGWSYQALSEPARILAASSPAISGDTVVAAFGSGELVALRAANGNDLWSEALSRASRTNALSEIRDIPGRPAIYQGDVYAVSHSGVFAATDLRTGSQKWTLPVSGITTPWPAGDVVFVVSKAGEVMSVSRESGQVYWVRDLSVGREKKTGQFFGLFGRKFSSKPIWSSPLLASNRLILGGQTGEIVSLNAKTGEVERTIKVGGPVIIGPIAMGDTIYVVTDEAQLIALR
ncbi:MAG: PQQ-binding-like beta-propeller repeat protein [Caulobacteraceae bacterium]|nr:PQQ-binding-like beta-propeller repeat protein [Caulobacteraceae bacterium]